MSEPSDSAEKKKEFGYRAIFVDRGVIVKTIPCLARRPEYHLALPQGKLKVSNTMECSMSEPVKRRIFKFSFHEDETDVYTVNSKLIPYFGYTMMTGHAYFVKTDQNLLEIIKSVLVRRIKWFQSILKDREVSKDEIELSVDLMAKDILKNIGL